MKTRKDNYMMNCSDVIYTKNKIELLWSIELNSVYDKNMTGQWRDRSYRSSLHPKNKFGLLGPIDWVWYVMITRQNNGLTDHIGVI